MNTISAVYVGVWGGALGAVAAVTVVPSMLASGAGFAYGATGVTGTVVLGQYPEYVEVAEGLGAKAMNVAPRYWNALTVAGQSWSFNQGFLQGAIFRGQNFFYASSISAAEGSYLTELQYLASRGVTPPVKAWLTYPFYGW